MDRIEECKHCGKPLTATNYNYRPNYGTYHRECEERATGTVLVTGLQARLDRVEASTHKPRERCGEWEGGSKGMNYEYHVMHFPSGNAAHITDRIEAWAKDGWEPHLFSPYATGDTDFPTGVFVVLRRKRA